jgi:hypothetical protein
MDSLQLCHWPALGQGSRHATPRPRALPADSPAPPAPAPASPSAPQAAPGKSAEAAKGQNPKAFAFQSAGKARASRARSAEKEQRRMHGEGFGWGCASRRPAACLGGKGGPGALRPAAGRPVWLQAHARQGPLQARLLACCGGPTRLGRGDAAGRWLC